MTFKEFIRGANHYFLDNPGMRYGQALVNYLKKVDAVAYALFPEEVDPLYDDSKTNDFLAYLHGVLTNEE